MARSLICNLQYDCLALLMDLWKQHNIEKLALAWTSLRHNVVSSSSICSLQNQHLFYPVNHYVWCGCAIHTMMLWRECGGNARSNMHFCLDFLITTVWQRGGSQIGLQMTPVRTGPSALPCFWMICRPWLICVLEETRRETNRQVGPLGQATLYTWCNLWCIVPVWHIVTWQDSWRNM